MLCNYGCQQLESFWKLEQVYYYFLALSTKRQRRSNKYFVWQNPHLLHIIHTVETGTITIKLFFFIGAQASLGQGCQIFIGAWYQNRKNVPNEHKTYQMVIKFSKWPWIYINVFKSEAYQNFWFENKPSGNPALRLQGMYTNCFSYSAIKNSCETSFSTKAVKTV
jgi:hypothetical protein